MYQQPSNRRSRRRRYNADYHNVTGMRLPGLLGVITNPKLFLGAMIVMGISMLFAILPGFSTGGNTNTASNGQVHQANELPDQPLGTPDANATGTPQAQATPTAVVKRYDTPPSMAIDPSKQYIATIKTAKGDIKIQLDAKDAPQTVNSFVFLARQGYYNDTPFMQLVKNNDGSKFVAQAGDPTCHSGTPCQALGTPGYSIPKETTPLPFSRGAVGMGGSSPTSNGGQFFISFGDYPALNGKYTIFGQVIAGQDVLDKLSLMDLTQADPGQADTILSIDITEA
jgi:cyclophilin family peptidyl-prolyl cis-trans isomerase